MMENLQIESKEDRSVCWDLFLLLTLHLQSILMSIITLSTVSPTLLRTPHSAAHPGSSGIAGTVCGNVSGSDGNENGNGDGVVGSNSMWCGLLGGLAAAVDGLDAQATIITRALQTTAIASKHNGQK